MCCSDVTGDSVGLANRTNDGLLAGRMNRLLGKGSVTRTGLSYSGWVRLLGLGSVTRAGLSYSGNFIIFGPSRSIGVIAIGFAGRQSAENASADGPLAIHLNASLLRKKHGDRPWVTD